MRFDAAITAGGRIAGDYAREAGTSIKALAVVGGSSMLERMVDAVHGAGAQRVAVIGAQEVIDVCADRIDLPIAEGRSGAENVVRALRAFAPSNRPLLLTASDLPFVSAAPIADFLSRVPAGALALPLVERRAYTERFPGAPPAGIELADGDVVNADLFLIPPAALARIESATVKLFEGRKQPWRMAQVVGAWTLLRWWLGRLRIAHLEQRATQVAGVRAVALRSCAAELAFDADTIAEYRYARACE